jgi:DNA-binding transcriptional MerR regulator
VADGWRARLGGYAGIDEPVAVPRVDEPVAARPRAGGPARGYGDVYVNVNLTPEKLRIGSFAALTGTTPRTIRYYEEIGLLPCPREREQGQHRCYTRADVERVKEIVRLRDLLGLSLEQLSQVIAVGDPRAELLKRVRARRRELSDLERKLTE